MKKLTSESEKNNKTENNKVTKNWLLQWCFSKSENKTKVWLRNWITKETRKVK